MFRLALAVLLFLPALASAQSYWANPIPTPAPIQIAWGAVQMAGVNEPGPTPTATPPPGLTVVCQMDFEDVGCEDGDSDASCSATGNFEPDCTAIEHEDCPIGPTGIFSAWSDGTAETTNWMQFNNDESCADTEKVTIDFQFMLVDDTDAAGRPTKQLLMVRDHDNSFSILNLWVEEDQTPIQMDANCDGANTADWVITVDTLYNIRIDVDTGGAAVDNECTIYVDTAASDDWGVGAVKSSGVMTGNTDADIGVTGVNFQDTTENHNFVIDNIGICDAAAGFLAAGTQCMYPTPTPTPTATPAPDFAVAYDDDFTSDWDWEMRSTIGSCSWNETDGFVEMTANDGLCFSDFDGSPGGNDQPDSDDQWMYMERGDDGEQGTGPLVRGLDTQPNGNNDYNYVARCSGPDMIIRVCDDDKDCITIAGEGTEVPCDNGVSRAFAMMVAGTSTDTEICVWYWAGAPANPDDPSGWGDASLCVSEDGALSYLDDVANDGDTAVIEDWDLNGNTCGGAPTECKDYPATSQFYTGLYSGTNNTWNVTRAIAGTHTLAE